jgi:hypothetical protein
MREEFSTLRTDLLQLFEIPSLAPDPVRVNCQLPGHRDLRGLSSVAHGKMEKLATPLHLTAHRDLRCFDQQIAKQ